MQSGISTSSQFIIMAKRKVKRRTSTKRRRVRRTQKRGTKFLHTLRRLKALNASQRQQAMGIANNKFIRDFSKAVKKLRSQKNMSPSLRKRLKKHTSELRKLAGNKTALNTKRQILSQRGGFLPLLLAALPAVGSIIGGVISRS